MHKLHANMSSECLGEGANPLLQISMPGKTPFHADHELQWGLILGYTICQKATPVWRCMHFMSCFKPEIYVAVLRYRFSVVKHLEYRLFFSVEQWLTNSRTLIKGRHFWKRISFSVSCFWAKHISLCFLFTINNITLFKAITVAFNGSNNVTISELPLTGLHSCVACLSFNRFQLAP